VFDAGLLRDGKARIDVETISNDSNAQPKFESVMVPAVLVQAPNGFRLPSGVLAPRLAKRLGVEGDIAREFLIDTTREPTEREIDRAQGQIERLGGDMYLMVERGFTDQVGLGLLALLAASAIVTFGASGIATGLALAESRPDMSTLAAVGAAPRVRRVLSMAQAGTIAGLGAGLGVLAGLVPAIAVISARDDFPLVIPWPTLGATVVVVPALAALCAGLFTRSRLPLERRIA
jgi:putative ABC transport system permease protein